MVLINMLRSLRFGPQSCGLLGLFLCILLMHSVTSLCDMDVSAFSHISQWPAVTCLCACAVIFVGGTPTSRPNEAQLRFAVQRVEVALQLTHELLKAICGRWHSPLFPQPRRQQQMVAVKTQNIKQLPFILFSQVAII